MPEMRADEAMGLTATDENRQFFSDLLERHRESIRGTIVRATGSHQAVDDLLQETSLRAYRALKGGFLPDNAGAWLCGIARNCSREWMRRKRESPLDGAIAESGPAVSAFEERELDEKVRKALLDLSPDARRVLVMRYQRRMTFEEVARTTGRPIGTVMSLAARAHQRLRRELSEFFEGR